MRLMQGGGILIASLLIFFVFYTTRDILLRTSSLLYQLFCILIVALLPVIGFFLYILIRPARTIKERELERMLKVLVPEKKETSSKFTTPTPAFSSYEAKAKVKTQVPKKKTLDEPSSEKAL